jgi:heparosan-N-sulfate-glucuronate 5-epimerase
MINREFQTIDIKKQIIICAISLSLVLILSVCANNVFLTKPAYSTADNSIAGIYISIDNSSVPIVDYGYMDEIYIGPQRNAVTTTNKALSYYEEYNRTGDDYSKRAFLNNSDWLVNNAVPKGNYSIFEYKFPWPPFHLKPLWHDGMAQGRAIQVLIKAHEITGDEKYLDSAKLLLNSFFVEVKNGGVTYKTPNDGWWYEHYAGVGGDEPRVLNAMLFTILGIYEYYEYTHDPAAKYLFDQGVLALKKDLPRYEYYNGTYSTYHVLNNQIPASLSYHDIHVKLLGDLYKITREEIFKIYHDKWKNFNISETLFQKLDIYDNPSELELRFNLKVANKNMSIVKIIQNSSSDSIPQIFRIEGSTDNKTVVDFSSQIFDYRGKHISLIIGNAVKSPRDLPIEFIFNIKSIDDDEDHRLIFVHGPTTQGWRDNKYYVKIDSNSSASVNLKHLFGDGYLSVNQIVIAIPKEMTVSPLEFSVNFNGTIENAE